MRRSASHFASRFFTSGKRHRFNPRIDNQLFHLFCFDQKGLKDAFFKSGATKNVLNCERALRHVGCMFEQPDISSHQGRRGKPKYLPEREIPWHNRNNGYKQLKAQLTKAVTSPPRLVIQEAS